MSRACSETTWLGKRTSSSWLVAISLFPIRLRKHLVAPAGASGTTSTLVRNHGDWSVEFLFGEIGAFDCSRARFAAVLQDAVYPLARSGEEQLQTVTALNKILARDGYELAVDGDQSGHPIYAFRPIIRGVRGRKT
ncbi:hypothetical protein [Bradyrhizobium sp. CB3481]|uniref:AbiJ-related protein n=1 Tax=Bradyrhizobium sp. CB3481 TaxID=3039158 RepID=UPI0024B14648|nr:hypothetical protein [Bradyrhizobium sp. CB3481]WFU14499.1 hypothetical protein QA643_25415 [Bradyrhizobium sp. CB3481]